MCGIFGFYKPRTGKLYWADNLIPEMFFMGQIRGRDACGVFAQKEPGEKPDHMKMAGPADQFLDWKEPHERVFKQAEEMRFVVGHNRATSVGEAGVDGAHPHQVGAITLVHNGTLSTWGGKEKEKFYSDSHWLAHLLNEDPAGDFREVEKKVFGAFACVWHDARDDTLNFVRNSQRPLSFVRTDDNGLWFGSEADMLVWLLRRRNRVVKDVWELRPGLWVKISAEHKIREIAVPFHMRGSSTVNSKGSPVEEYFQTKEAIRATETLNYGRRNVRHEFQDCEFAAAPVVQHSRPTYHASSESSSHGRSLSVSSGPWGRQRSGLQPSSPVIAQFPLPIGSPRDTNPASIHRRGRSDDKPEVLKQFMGLEVGDVVHFYPMDARAAGTDEKRVQVSGVLGVYDNTGNISFVPGVEICCRLAVQFDNPDENVGDKVGQIFMHEFIYQAEITSLQYDPARKRIRLYAKEAKPLDWFDFRDYPGQDAGTAKSAWESTYTLPTTASEVAAEEKKVVEAGRTFY